jgi:hypothetical protein
MTIREHLRRQHTQITGKLWCGTVLITTAAVVVIIEDQAILASRGLMLAGLIAMFAGVVQLKQRMKCPRCDADLWVGLLDRDSCPRCNMSFDQPLDDAGNLARPNLDRRRGPIRG